MAPNAQNPISTASTCAIINAACCDISCGPPYVNQFIMTIYIVSSMTTVYPQMTILCVFGLCALSIYTVYRVLTVYMIGAMSETEILSCYVARVCLL